MSGFGLFKSNLVGFTPNKIGGCIQWLHAKFGITLTAGKVSQWDDKSSKGNHAFQTDPSIRPTVNVVGINSRETVAFTNPQVLVYPLFNVQPPATVVFVAKTAANPALNYGGLASYSAGAGGVFIFTVAGGINQWGFYANSNALSGQSINVYKKCICIARAYTDIDFRTNGSSVNSTAGTSAYFTASTLGDGFSTGGQNIEGDIAEIIVYNRALSVVECQRLEGYLAAQYAL